MPSTTHGHLVLVCDQTRGHSLPATLGDLTLSGPACLPDCWARVTRLRSSLDPGCREGRPPTASHLKTTGTEDGAQAPGWQSTGTEPSSASPSPGSLRVCAAPSALSSSPQSPSGSVSARTAQHSSPAPDTQCAFDQYSVKDRMNVCQMLQMRTIRLPVPKTKLTALFKLLWLCSSSVGRMQSSTDGVTSPPVRSAGLSNHTDS